MITITVKTGPDRSTWTCAGCEMRIDMPPTSETLYVSTRGDETIYICGNIEDVEIVARPLIGRSRRRGQRRVLIRALGDVWIGHGGATASSLYKMEAGEEIVIEAPGRIELMPPPHWAKKNA